MAAVVSMTSLDSRHVIGRAFQPEYTKNLAQHTCHTVSECPLTAVQVSLDSGIGLLAIFSFQVARYKSNTAVAPDDIGMPSPPRVYVPNPLCCYTGSAVPGRGHANRAFTSLAGSTIHDGLNSDEKAKRAKKTLVTSPKRTSKIFSLAVLQTRQ